MQDNFLRCMWYLTKGGQSLFSEIHGGTEKIKCPSLMVMPINNLVR